MAPCFRRQVAWWGVNSMAMWQHAGSFASSWAAVVKDARCILVGEVPVLAAMRQSGTFRTRCRYVCMDIRVHPVSVRW